MEDIIGFAIYKNNTAAFQVTGRVNAAFTLLFYVLGLPWNILVIGIILKRKLFTRPSVMLLLNLAISNFFVCLLIMPVSILVGIDAEGVFKTEEVADKLCQSGVLLVLLPQVSTYTIALMSVDRVIYLKKPLTYEHRVTPWRMFSAIVAVWLVCSTVSAPPLFGFGSYGLHEVRICGLIPDTLYGTFYYIVLVVVFALATLLQIFCCGVIIYIARKHLLKKLNRLRGLQIDNSTSEYKKSQLQLVKVFGAIVSVTLLTWIPALGLIAAYNLPSSSPLYTISYLSVMVRAVINPMLEAYMTHEIREIIRKFHLSCVSRCKQDT